MEDKDRMDDLETVVPPEEAREEPEEEKKYVPRPRWQLIMAWVLIAIVILGVINICWWQMTI